MTFLHSITQPLCVFFALMSVFDNQSSCPSKASPFCLELRGTRPHLLQNLPSTIPPPLNCIFNFCLFYKHVCTLGKPTVSWYLLTSSLYLQAPWEIVPYTLSLISLHHPYFTETAHLQAPKIKEPNIKYFLGLHVLLSSHPLPLIFSYASSSILDICQLGFPSGFPQPFLWLLYSWGKKKKQEQEQEQAFPNVLPLTFPLLFSHLLFHWRSSNLLPQILTCSLSSHYLARVTLCATLSKQQR